MSFAETMAALDGVLARERARAAPVGPGLADIVAGLDGGMQHMDEEPAARPPGRAAQPPQQYAILPKRTTHGGGFGPSVRAKLRSEALGRGR